MIKITEIIPDSIPEWAKVAMDDGQFFRLALERISNLEAQLKDREWQVDNPHESILNTVNRGKFLVEVEYIRSSVTFTRVETAWFSKSEGWEIDASVQRWMLLPPPYSPKEQDNAS